MSAAEFFASACSDFALVPALFHVAKHKRHFELFIGTFQFVAALLYNTSHALATKFFLSYLQWHFINDVLALTFVCCLLIHCMGNKSEDLNIILRYLAFSLAWIFKLRDQWDSANWEIFLVIAYLVAAAYGAFVLNPRVRKLWNYEAMQRGGICCLIALVFLGLHLDPSMSPIFTGLMHLAAVTIAHTIQNSGGASFYFWQAVPVFDKVAQTASMV